MAAEVILLNPSPLKRKSKRRGGSMAKRARSKRTGRFLKKGRHQNPSPHKRRKTSHSRKRTNPWKGHHAGHVKAARKGWRHRRRRNPSGMLGNIGAMVAPMAGGATALLVDALLSKATETRPEWQARLQTGWGRPIVQAAAAVGVGALLAMAKQRRAGMAVTAGGLAVAGYSAAKILVQQFAPTITLGDGTEYPELSFWNPSPVLTDSGSGVSEFLPDGGRGVGEFLPRGDMAGLMEGADSY